MEQLVLQALQGLKVLKESLVFLLLVLRDHKARLALLDRQVLIAL